MAADGVDFVDENNARRVRLALLEQIAHARRTDTDEHFHEVGTRHREERTSRFAGHGLGEQRFTRARRTDQQCTLRQATTELGVLLRVLQKLDDLLQFNLRFISTGDVGKGDLGCITAQQLRFALAEGERLVSTGLHLPEQENPEADQQHVRQHRNEQTAEVWPRLAGIRPDTAFEQACLLLFGGARHESGHELPRLAVVHAHRLAELTGQHVVRLESRRFDVTDFELLSIRVVVELRRLSFPTVPVRQKGDRDQNHEDPERQRLGEASPIRRLLRRGRHVCCHR